MSKKKSKERKRKKEGFALIRSFHSLVVVGSKGTWRTNELHQLSESPFKVKKVSHRVTNLSGMTVCLSLSHSSLLWSFPSVRPSLVHCCTQKSEGRDREADAAACGSLSLVASFSRALLPRIPRLSVHPLSECVLVSHIQGTRKFAFSFTHQPSPFTLSPSHSTDPPLSLSLSVCLSVFLSLSPSLPFIHSFIHSFIRTTNRLAGLGLTLLPLMIALRLPETKRIST